MPTNSAGAGVIGEEEDTDGGLYPIVVHNYEYKRIMQSRLLSTVRGAYDAQDLNAFSIFSKKTHTCSLRNSIYQRRRWHVYENRFKHKPIKNSFEFFQTVINCFKMRFSSRFFTNTSILTHAMCIKELNCKRYTANYFCRESYFQ